MAGKIWTEQEEMKLFELYEKYSDEQGRFLEYKVKDEERIGGRSTRALSARLEMSYNIKTLSMDPNIKREINKRVIELYKDGLSYRQIAKDAGCSEVHARNKVRQYHENNPNQPKVKPKKTRNMVWTAEEERHVLDTANKYLNPDDGTVQWKQVPTEYIIRGRSPMRSRFNESIRPDSHYDVKRKKWFCPRLASVNPGSATPDTPTPTTPTPSTKEFVTVRRTFLWGAYKHETIRYE